MLKKWHRLNVSGSRLNETDAGAGLPSRHARGLGGDYGLVGRRGLEKIGTSFGTSSNYFHFAGPGGPSANLTPLALPCGALTSKRGPWRLECAGPGAVPGVTRGPPSTVQHGVTCTAVASNVTCTAVASNGVCARRAEAPPPPPKG